jgi:DNA-binding transcriptional ArsR family regulator
MSEATSATADVSAPNLLAARLRLSMVRLSRQLHRMDPNELTITQFSALATVVGCGRLGVGQLAEIEGLPSPAATRLADKLEEAGLVDQVVESGLDATTGPVYGTGSDRLVGSGHGTLFTLREHLRTLWVPKTPSKRLTRLSHEPGLVHIHAAIDRGCISDEGFRH